MDVDGNSKYLVCKGETYPALLMYQELADMACNKITAAITRKFEGERPIKALLDAYNPTGSTCNVRFNTSKTDRWETSSKHCHLNWVILDSDWEGEFCRVAESNPKVLAYVKNHNLGLEVPYRFGSVMRKYLPDFVVLVDDGHGPADPLHLVVEIKGYRGEDAVEKKSTMDTYWVPGVKPRVQTPAVATANPFDHPDAQRRFRVMTNLAELETALNFPWEKWTVFLHPEQRQWVERDYTGPARVSGAVGQDQCLPGESSRKLASTGSH